MGKLIDDRNGDRDWKEYWDELRPRRLFAAEAKDYVSKLLVERPLPATAQVLDFGCGFGYVADLIASSVARMTVWDSAANLRAAAAERLRKHPNVAVVDLSETELGTLHPRYDTILVNSVVQYMSRGELAEWLDRWRILLRPGGQVVVSDLPVPGGSTITELLGVLRFAARHGILGAVVLDGLAELRRYARRREAQPLLRLTPDEFGQLAAHSGLVMTQLSHNLTHRRWRYSVVLVRCPGYRETMGGRIRVIG